MDLSKYGATSDSELGDQQEVLNLDVPWNNWLDLGSEYPNIFCFVMFGITRLQITFFNPK
jgi:hypothetical protein